MTRSGRRFAGRRMVAVSMLVMTAAFGLNFAAGLFFSPLSQRYGWNVGALSVAAAANTAITGLLQPVVGRLVDRVGPRRVLTVGLGLLAACYVLLAGVRQLWQFLLVYPLLGGAGFAAAATLANSVLVSRWYVRDRTKMLARSTAGINLGQLLILPVAGWLIAGQGTATAYLALGVMVAVTAVPAAALLLRDEPAALGQFPDGALRQVPTPRSSSAAVCSGLKRRHRLALVSFGLHAMSLYFVILHLPRYVVDLGGAVATGGQVLAGAATASAVMMPAIGRLVVRFERETLLLTMHLLRGAALLLAAASTTAWLLFVFAVLFGLSSFPVIPLTIAVLLSGRDQATLGRVMGRIWLVHQACAGLGVLVGGLTRATTGTFRPYFLVAAALMATSSLLVHRLTTATTHRPGPAGRPVSPTPRPLSTPDLRWPPGHRPPITERRSPVTITSHTEGRPTVHHRTAVVNGRTVFYREAGDPATPTLVLLHGFPTSSHMFRRLIVDLADSYHLIAPDHIGFGYSDAPTVTEFEYSFDNLTAITVGLLDQLGLDEFALYIQDYGAPIGLRIAHRQPERVTALIVQSGNAYTEGFTPFWDVLFAHAQDRAGNEAEVRKLLELDATRWQYTHGVPTDRLDRLTPDTWTLDQALLDRPGNKEVQLQLFYDYQFNVDIYPAVQEYFRTHQPPTLITWGDHDEIFGADGARAYQRDLPDADLHLLDAGHFALETHSDEIAALIRGFLARTFHTDH